MADLNSFQVTSLEAPAKPPFDYNRLAKWLVILALVVAAGGITFFIFNRSTFSPDKVDLKIEVPAEAASGDKVDYKITYTNHNNQTISNLELTFFYPSDAVDVKNNQLVNLQTETVKLDSLAPGEEKSADFSAYLVGNRGDIKKARAVFSFYGQDIPTNFKKEQTVATNISTLPVSLTLDAPPNAISGQTVNYVLDYRNESEDAFSNLRFKFSYPNGFATAAKNVFEVGSLQKGAGDRISVSGTLSGAEKEEKDISITLQRQINGVYVDFEKTTSNTVLATAPLTAKVLLNDQSNYTVILGDYLQYQIQLTNNTSVDLSGLTVSAKLEGSMFDFSSIQATGGNFDSTAHTVNWNSSSSSNLAHLAPGQTGSVVFRVKIKDSFPASGVGIKDSIIKVSAHAETATVPPGFDLNKLAADTSLVNRVVEALTPTPQLLP